MNIDSELKFAIYRYMVYFPILHVLFITEVLVWSGIKKGPPRKLKFPEPEVVLKAINDAM